jgi:3-hydroxybutyryl-CoA dehydratase
VEDIMISYTINDMHVGQKVESTRTVTEADVVNYAGISGDFNPIHINKEYAERSPFRQRVAHGMLGAGMAVGLSAAQLPGAGAIHISIDIKFLKPVFIGDTITCSVAVEEILIEKNRAVMRTTIRNQEGDIVTDGTMAVMPRAE